MPDLSLVTNQFLEEFDALDAAATPGPWRAQCASDEDYVVYGPDNHGEVAKLWSWTTAPQNTAFIVRARAAVPLFVATIRKLQADLAEMAAARAAAEDELERVKAQHELDLAKVRAERHEALEQTGRYAALAAHDDAQARATLERHGLLGLHFGCDTLDHVCESLVGAREELAQMRFAARRNPPTQLNNGPSYIVMRQRETDPWEVAYFTDRDDAMACFDFAGSQWTFTFLVVPLARAELAESRVAELERRLLANETSWQAYQTGWANLQERLEGMRGERDGERDLAVEWEKKCESLQDDKDHLLDALDKDATGLAHALAGIQNVITGRSWVTESRGPYYWNDDRYKRETYQAFQAITKILGPALQDSGTRANDAWRTFERGRILKLRGDVTKLRTAGRELLESLGEYVRQSMDGNPEWQKGIRLMETTLREVQP